MEIKKQEILEGSSYLKSKQNKKFDRIDFMIEYMAHNSAYKNHLKKNKIKDKNFKILKKFKKKFYDYRFGWKNNAKKYYNNNLDFGKIDTELQDNPLCVDIETAAICDLACPHCFREYLITPDKIMNFDLYKKIINSLSKMDVPSIKLNWRGEPLLNPQLGNFIKYAKENEILEVSINTNATKLDKKKSEELIKSGLDLIIFSFDGGTKETYEKMRPGRFSHNNFETVYNKIKDFCSIRKKMNSPYPITKIQMVLTKESRNEIKEFFNLFDSIVDDVTVTQYSERGGNMNDLLPENEKKIKDYLKKNNLPESTPHLVEVNGKIHISKKRIPCEQLFQRLMVTYDGRVGMCCHDWGARHCIGYVDKKGFETKNAINEVENRIRQNKKGFELLKNAKKPEDLNIPNKKVNNLKEIWNSEELNCVRDLHKKNRNDEVAVCKNCSFKDTYDWTEI